MNHKIITYFLLSVFLFSTIGVPVTIHYCQMKETISLDSCGMCKKDTLTFCDFKNSGTALVSNTTDSCCNDKVISDPLTEKYISAIYEIQKADVKDFVYVIPSEALLSENLTNSTFASDNSPPDSFSNSLYLFNSIFLI